MSSEIAQPGFYYDDFAVGRSWETPPQDVNAEAVSDYAEAWDPLPIHIDEAAATASPHGGLIASGEHTFVIMRRALWNLGLLTHTSGIVDQNELRLLAPVRPGDSLSIRATCTDRQSEGNAGGRVTLKIEVTNQSRVVVLTCIETQEVANAPGA